MPFLAKEHVSLPNKDILSWTFDDLNYNWDEPIYIDALEPERSYTARQAWTTIRKLAAGFQAMGVKQGDCVCIHSFNDISYPIFFLGLIAAGGIFAGTNPAYTQFELEHTLQTAKVKFVIVHPDLAKNMSQAAAANGIPKENVWIFNPKGESAPKGMTQWNDLLQHGEQDWIRFDDYKTSYDTTAARLYSSGTSGLPKATMVSHYNLIAQHTLVYESPPRPYEARRLFALPMFHAATSPVAFTTPLRTGEKAYVLPKFDLENWFWAHQEYKITDLGAVPPIVVMAINSPLAKKYSLKSAKVGTIGAAPLDKHPQARLKALMADGAPVAQVWGMTETSCICTRHPYPQNDDTASVGFPVPNIDVKFVDDDGKDITAYDVRGEICVRGPTIIRGYFENPEANERDWDADGYFHTGDIGFIDGKTGFYYIVDRKKVRSFLSTNTLSCRAPY